VRQILLFVGIGAAICLLFVGRAIWQFEVGREPQTAQLAAPGLPQAGQDSGPLRVVSSARVGETDLDRLRSRSLMLPVAGQSGFFPVSCRTLPPECLKFYFSLPP
jgi:hypothetical protein